jgi:dihydroxy-acid dehydratase
VVLTTGCDKTTPAQMMAAATVNHPGHRAVGRPDAERLARGQRTGSGTVVWKARERLAAGEIDYRAASSRSVASSAPSVGHCNTMGTASTMNALAEALGMTLPGCAAIPAPYRERGQMAYLTGRRIVEMVWENLKPSKTPDARGLRELPSSSTRRSAARPMRRSTSTRIAAMSASSSSIEDWQKSATTRRCWSTCSRPASISARSITAPAACPPCAELLEHKRIHEGALTVNGRTMGENCKGAAIDRDVIKGYDKPLKKEPASSTCAATCSTRRS